MTEQIYHDTATNQQYDFDPTVTVVANVGGGFTFTAADGEVLPESTITTMVSGPAPGPTLAQAQEAQASIVNASCAAAIVESFTSSALGTANTYDCTPVDQRNIDLVAVHGGSLWMLPSGSSTWAFTVHTAEQGLQVQSDMLSHIQAQQTTYAGLLTQINAASTVAAVQAVTWPGG